MSFYRIYRPQIFEELDNAHVRESLHALLAKEKKDLPHAFLFSGPRGTGKTTAARLIAKLFQCEKPRKSGEPCGECDQCKAIAAGTAMDVLEIDAASNTGVDNIRDLREKIALAPSVAKWKVYIIDEVHMLSTGAFNALLKTLEEPPAHAIFILATTDIQKVPLTIVSRCMHIVFTRPGVDELAGALRRIVEKEKISIDDDALGMIASSADGSFRDAVKLLEQVSFHKGKITSDVVCALLVLSSDQEVAEFIAAFSHRQAKEALAKISDVVKNGKDVKTFITSCLTVLEQILIHHVEGTRSETLSIEDTKDMIRRLSQAFAETRGASIAQLPLELAVVEFCSSASSFPRRRESITESSTKSKKELIPDQSLPRTRYGVGDDKKVIENESSSPPLSGMLTLDKLNECWKDFIEAAKPYNHSVAGVLRSSRPKEVKDGIVTIEAFYKFHQEKLSEPKTREVLATVLKKLFGEKVKVDIVLGKKGA